MNIPSPSKKQELLQEESCAKTKDENKHSRSYTIRGTDPQVLSSRSQMMNFNKNISIISVEL